MGGGEYNNFGASSGNSNSKDISLPKENSQLSHIFNNRDGHLPDTPGNRQKLVDLANDNSKFVGVDKYGNSWNVSNNEDGTQTWVIYQEKVIQNGGENKNPRKWNDDTGLSNPYKKGKKNK